VSDYKYGLMVDKSEMHMLSEFYLLFHHNHMSFFDLGESIILFISAPEVGTILMSWNLKGNESFKKETGSSFLI
jgi:hypothetical protein